jgi:hypothetical protein
VEGDMKALRSAANIEYVGKFAEGAASGATAAAAPASAAPVTPAAASGLSADDITKGMGIKK